MLPKCKRVNGGDNNTIKTHLNTGHDTPPTPPVPPIANSSALPLKSLITFPVLTSKIFMTTLCGGKHHN